MTVESVLMNEYHIYRTRTSALGIRQDIETCEGFRCPRCDCPNPLVEHGWRSRCPNCDLYFQLWGNGLYCSDEPFKASNFELDGQASDEDTGWPVIVKNGSGRLRFPRWLTRLTKSGK
jgi:hypothetical protein